MGSSPGALSPLLKVSTKPVNSSCPPNRINSNPEDAGTTDDECRVAMQEVSLRRAKGKDASLATALLASRELRSLKR